MDFRYLYLLNEMYQNDLLCFLRKKISINGKKDLLSIFYFNFFFIFHVISTNTSCYDKEIEAYIQKNYIDDVTILNQICTHYALLSQEFGESIGIFLEKREKWGLATKLYENIYNILRTSPSPVSLVFYKEDIENSKKHILNKAYAEYLNSVFSDNQQYIF